MVTETESMRPYAHDETEELIYMPQVVLKPRTAQEIGAGHAALQQPSDPVTPRGAGTGLSGGALPHLGGVLISMNG